MSRSARTLLMKIFEDASTSFFIPNKFKTGIYTVDFSLLKELFCNLILRRLLEIRKIKQKLFYMFNNKFEQWHKANQNISNLSFFII